MRLGEVVCMSTLGERIREARKGKGWSMQVLADNLGASKSVISLYESDKRRPMEAVLMSIASVTGVNFRWLNSGQGDMYGEAEDIRRVEEDFILAKLSAKDRECLARYLRLDAPDRRNIRTRLNVWIDKIEARYAEEEQEEGN